MSDDEMDKARDVVTAWWGEDEDFDPEGSPHDLVAAIAHALRAAYNAGQVDALEEAADSCWGHINDPDLPRPPYDPDDPYTRGYEMATNTIAINLRLKADEMERA